jgi:hypothetical protein
MKKLISYLFLLLLFNFSLNFSAQNNVKQSCSGEKYNQFDFWEGNWNVYNTKGKLIGTNTIIKLQNNCILQENWVSKTSNSKGTSYNYYNKLDDTWNQVWIDNSGFNLVLKGKIINGQMVLKSDLIKTKKGNYFNRITWYKNEDKSVTQLWENIDKNNKVISEVFRGIYKKN